MAIVKANAYGHGLDLIAPALFDTGCRSFGVTDATEGALLRDLVANSAASEITLLSGVFDAEDARLAQAKQLTPAITEPDQIALLHSAGFKGEVWVKVNSGMNRLGADAPEAMLNQCRQAGLAVRGIMSHLACADTPEHPLNRSQAASFSRLHQNLAPDLPFSLLNSAGILTMPEYCFDVVRPGISLYGSEPVANKNHGFKPVMRLTGKVMQTREINAGESVSYGDCFTAPAAMRIAVINLGYADGLPRALSNRGCAIFEQNRLPVIGRICMDYALLDITHADVKRGDSVEFWGNALLADDIADMLDTISYALFTGVGERVQRIAEI